MELSRHQQSVNFTAVNDKVLYSEGNINGLKTTAMKSGLRSAWEDASKLSLTKALNEDYDEFSREF